MVVAEVVVTAMADAAAAAAAAAKARNIFTDKMKNYTRIFFSFYNKRIHVDEYIPFVFYIHYNLSIYADNLRARELLNIRFYITYSINDLKWAKFGRKKEMKDRWAGKVGDDVLFYKIKVKIVWRTGKVLFLRRWRKKYLDHSFMVSI